MLRVRLGLVETRKMEVLATAARNLATPCRREPAASGQPPQGLALLEQRTEAGGSVGIFTTCGQARLLATPRDFAQPLCEHSPEPRLNLVPLAARNRPRPSHVVQPKLHRRNTAPMDANGRLKGRNDALRRRRQPQPRAPQKVQRRAATGTRAKRPAGDLAARCPNRCRVTNCFPRQCNGARCGGAVAGGVPAQQEGKECLAGFHLGGRGLPAGTRRRARCEEGLRSRLALVEGRRDSEAEDLQRLWLRHRSAEQRMPQVVPRDAAAALRSCRTEPRPPQELLRRQRWL
mmetsp:Transcript_36059/g.118708  ORF Transcript_36059/g.118708 Transcript_36059/m.118708 type:complete len:289 (+) Transcript_36059:613-1479(+)